MAKMIDKLLITGGRALHGEVTINGSKNAATKLMIASLLTDEPVTIHNCPRIGDVEITAEICQALGANVSFEGTSLRMHTPEIKNTKSSGLSRKNRISVLTLGPLLHRAKEAVVPVVGGDAIGPRPVNWHLEALRKMGATIDEQPQEYHAHAQQLVGTKIELPYPSVGATENVILAAALAQGQTVIRGAATEPEVIDLIKMLQQMGAIIELGANRVIRIEGVAKLSGVEYTVMPDRLEAASFALLAVATGGEITLHNTRQDDMLTFLNTLRRVNAGYSVSGNSMSFRREPGGLRATDIETDTWPGFATDWQQPLVVLLTQAQGRSTIHETVYEDRFGYVESLNAMGAKIEVTDDCLGSLNCRFNGQGHSHSAIISGPTPLHSHRLVIPDIRAGMAHVVAALIAEGESELTGAEHLMRGYGEGLLKKLKGIGAQFTTN